MRGQQRTSSPQDAVEVVSAPRGDVTDQSRPAVEFSHHYRGLLHRRVSQQRGFDLARFDAVTAQCHLTVGAANIFESAGSPTDQIAAAVHP